MNARVLKSPDTSGPRRKKYVPVVGPRLKKLLAVVFGLFALLAVNSAYLVGVSMLEWARGQTYQNWFYLVMFLIHLVLKGHRSLTHQKRRFGEGPARKITGTRTADEFLPPLHSLLGQGPMLLAVGEELLSLPKK